MEKTRLVVVGGGAAGLFCAVNAARLNASLEVLVLEKTSKLLSKVRISGGGRCNVTHSCQSISEMIRNYPRGGRFLKRAFRNFFTDDTIQWFEERGVRLKTEEDGRMFPTTDSSETIIECLLAEANRYGVRILMQSSVQHIESRKQKGDFVLQLASGQHLEADFVCIACGGLPKAFQYEWLQSLGHSFAEPVPSLFTFNIPSDPIRNLMGISVTHGRVRISGTSFSADGPLLITHWGLSGPAILRLSAFAARELAIRHYRFKVIVNWLGNEPEHAVLEKLRTFRNFHAGRKMVNRNPFGLPERLWEYLLRVAAIASQTTWGELPSRQQNLLAKVLAAQEFQVEGKTTFKEEFVTAGGISLSEIDPQSMESKMVAGLYFAGEIMDVDGITGGFNFQHAWTSGFIAGAAIAKAAESGVKGMELR